MVTVNYLHVLVAAGDWLVKLLVIPIIVTLWR
jgi:hypothetical protein